MLISFIFDTSIPAEAEMADRCWEFQRQQQRGVNEVGLAHILSTRSGQLVVLGGARHFQPDQRFTRADLAQAIGEEEDRVFSWIRQLGRPEKKYRMRVFVHHDDSSYSLTPHMHEAILRLAVAE